MLSEEEKKAIEFIKFYQQHCLKKEKENMKQYETVNDEEFVSKNLDTVLNLITKLQKHLNFYEKNESYKERIIELKEEITKLQKENELAKEQLKKQCEIADERNDLLVKVQELQKENKEKDEEISNLKIENNNAWEDWNNLEQASYEEELRLKEKIKEKDKTIDLMAEQLAGLTIWNNEKEEPLILYDKEEVKNILKGKSKMLKIKDSVDLKELEKFGFKAKIMKILEKFVHIKKNVKKI